MLKHIIILSGCMAILVNAYGNGGGGGYGGNGQSSGGYGRSNSYGGSIVPASIQSRHSIKYYDVPSSGYVQPTSIEVGASSIPLNIIFRSASSNLNVQQYHEGARGNNQETSSEDEPHRLVHTVTKPIIQEVHEVISPFRKVIQEIRPLQEEIQTMVARGTHYGNMGGGMNGGVGGLNGGIGGGMNGGGYGGDMNGGGGFGGGMGSNGYGYKKEGGY
ncbi:hypothetical protein RDWZM_005372 [Blomia tropicalis]|uniref:Uncharacterized protein n=1 Tax=Blomia tropicalis TaxID=40697 RepID=A0A9Q0M9B1_BLOTA|nr:hypothetical protein RDWZM_005372 [Blomia tropicalis]